MKALCLILCTIPYYTARLLRNRTYAVTSRQGSLEVVVPLKEAFSRRGRGGSGTSDSSEVVHTDMKILQMIAVITFR
jgi:hypothetical protein